VTPTSPPLRGTCDGCLRPARDHLHTIEHGEWQLEGEAWIALVPSVRVELCAPCFSRSTHDAELIAAAQRRAAGRAATEQFALRDELEARGSA
jgi:hypothetical protein